MIEQRFATLILTRDTFTADDLTLNGAVTIDPTHGANGGQNGIGRMFRIANQRGYIEWTGDVIASKSSHRRKGIIRVWQSTEAGRAWAAGNVNTPAQ